MPTFILTFLILGIVLVVAFRFGKSGRRFTARASAALDDDPETVAAQKGAEGEERLATRLPDLLPPESIILRNLLIPKHDCTTTELDLLAITPNGLFLIESKCFSGWIFGDVAGEHWTQSLPSRSGPAVKNQFLNPIRQNASHVRHLQTYLQERGHTPPIHSVIVFTGTAQLKSTPAYAPGHVITTLRHLPHVLAAILATHPATLGQDRIRAIADALSSAAHATDDDRARHVEALHAQAAVPRCPRCGAILVQRTATKGPNAGQTFLACPRYPQCRHTQPLDLPEN